MRKNNKMQTVIKIKPDEAIDSAFITSYLSKDNFLFTPLSTMSTYSESGVDEISGGKLLGFLATFIWSYDSWRSLLEFLPKYNVAFVTKLSKVWI